MQKKLLLVVIKGCYQMIWEPAAHQCYLDEVMEESRKHEEQER